MKKFLALALFVMTLATASAQHMTFMGIPLDGTISEFTAELEAKGINVSSSNKFIPTGARTFEGMFYGKPSLIAVYYAPATNIVYRAKAVIEDADFETLKQLYDEISESISNKYPGEHATDVQDGFECTTFKIDLGVYSDVFEGIVNLYFSTNEEEYPVTYNLHIDYTDTINEAQYKSSIEDDL